MSATTSLVLGNISRMMTICFAIVVLRDNINFSSGAGCALAFAGMLWYGYLKLLPMKHVDTSFYIQIDDDDEV